MQRVRGQLEDIVKTELQYISTMITDISNAAYETSDTDSVDTETPLTVEVDDDGMFT